MTHYINIKAAIIDVYNISAVQKHSSCQLIVYLKDGRTISVTVNESEQDELYDLIWQAISMSREPQISLSDEIIKAISNDHQKRIPLSL